MQQSLVQCTLQIPLGLSPVYSDTTQLDIELNCVAINTLTNAEQLSPTVADDRQRF